jgi:hypothetical protein
MAKYAVYAGDQQFGGLHGMCVHAVVEVSNEEKAHNWAREQSLEVIQSYSDIYEGLEENAKESLEGMTFDSEEEYNDALSEAVWEEYEQDAEWSVWLIDENKAQGLSVGELDEEFYDDPDGFIEEFCVTE